ncbi:hypothetical protein HMPREF0762_01350 [Slackia exigua ATCC 700122]|uniref:Uncharacterized protein n=1 Tax=Slackia exigua (strain ATCC 700122 / DSM 15923 / CIP 105133 / JCM 11022 / KCTC 5966 / S-7) TaxID=649764 RepID=D0WHN3_SLAES|nr:hypothetical protein HMPREF0762_01350 [Slackia exigua ATCC 700122]
MRAASFFDQASTVCNLGSIQTYGARIRQHLISREASDRTCFASVCTFLTEAKRISLP